MYLAIPKEDINNESRVAATPGTVKELINSGLDVYVETEAGSKSFISDKEYEEAGANIIGSGNEILSQADIIIKVLPPSVEQVSQIKPNAIVISLCQTTRELDLQYQNKDKRCKLGEEVQE